MSDKNDFFRAWREYDEAVATKCGDNGYTAHKFSIEKLQQGDLDFRPSEATAKVLFDAPKVTFRSDMTSPGYVTKAWDAANEAAMASTSHYREISGDLAVLMTACLDLLQEPVQSLLGTPWRVLNVRAYSTPPAAPPLRMYGWHRDGMPEAIFKVMIYFTPMDRAHGSLEVDEQNPRLLEGPANSWVLFYNSTIKHRGVAGIKNWRAAAEITLCRSEEFDLALHQPGLNAHWPERP